jgi:hypothetical protein
VVSPDGETCFAETYSGDGSNTGRSGSEENFVETVNRALDASFVALFNSRTLRNSLCGCDRQSPQPTNTEAAP